MRFRCLAEVGAAESSVLEVGALELTLLGVGVLITLGLAIAFLLLILRRDPANGPGGQARRHDQKQSP